jgi:four helix bundle protein
MEVGRGLIVCHQRFSHWGPRELPLGASGSVGANYIEANESLSKKDFIMRIKICRKEAKESRYWLKLIDIEGEKEHEKERGELEEEVTKLMKIFGSILRKSE